MKKLYPAAFWIMLVAQGLCLPSAQAGAWVRSKGSAYLKAEYGYYWASESYDQIGESASMSDERFVGKTTAAVFSEARYFKHDIKLFAEVGLGRGIEIIAALPFTKPTNQWVFLDGDNPDLLQTNLGTGDLELGMRYGGRLGRLPASIGFIWRAPLYNNDPSVLHLDAASQDFYDVIPPLGQGTIDLDVTGAVGTGLPFLGGWTQAESGLRVRNRHYSAAIPGQLQVGLKPVSRLYLAVESRWLVTLKNGTAPDYYYDENGKGPLIIDRQHRLQVAGQFGARLWKAVWLTGHYGFVPWGRRTARGQWYGIGIAWDR